MKSSIAILLLMISLFIANSETSLGSMAETKDAYRGPTDAAFIGDIRQQFRAEVEDFRNSELRRAAYRELFRTNPDVPIKPRCDLTKKFKNQNPTLSINYEAHGEKNANTEKLKLLEKANRGLATVLIESDMALSQRHDSFDKKIIEGGIARTMKNLGVKSEPNFQFTYGIDDARVRAFAIKPDLVEAFSQSESDVRVTEIFRNPVLRKTLRGIPLVGGLKAERLGVFTKLERLDAEPSLDLATINENAGDFFLANTMHQNLTRQFPATASFASKYPLGLFEIRDESMSRAILDRLCEHPNPTKEIHVVIGAMHIDGIKNRIGKILEDAGFKIEERNLMERAQSKPIQQYRSVR